MTVIEWTDETWNPVVGCTRVSAGCKNCYASALHNRRFRANEKQGMVFCPVFEHGDSERHIRPHENWPRNVKRVGRPPEGWASRGRSLGIKLPWPAQYDEPFAKVRCLSERLDIPLRWRKPRRIFANSMSDLFHEDVPDSFIDQVFLTMALAPQHTFQVLTKRPERMHQYITTIGRGRTIRNTYIADRSWHIIHLPKGAREEAGRRERCDYREFLPLSNVWLGISAENQEMADERIPVLLDTPAAVRFVSCEPLLGPIDFEILEEDSYENYVWPALTGEWAPAEPRPHGGATLDWVIVGGESGPKRREMELLWMMDIAILCAEANVPVFVKQDGAFRQGQQGRMPDDLWALKQFPEGVKS